MSALKLVNNSNLKEDKNLCFVNTTLQLLYSLQEIREFFKEKQYRSNNLERHPLCDEISRIFLTEGLIRTSAAELRKLVGQYHGRVDFRNGTQQDMEESTRILLGMIENELSNGYLISTTFLKKF